MRNRENCMERSSHKVSDIKLMMVTNPDEPNFMTGRKWQTIGYSPLKLIASSYLGILLLHASCSNLMTTDRNRNFFIRIIFIRCIVLMKPNEALDQQIIIYYRYIIEQYINISFLENTSYAFYLTGILRPVWVSSVIVTSWNHRTNLEDLSWLE